MKKMSKVSGIALAVLLAAPCLARAEEGGAPWYEKVKVGGELRLRSESQLRYTGITAAAPNNDSFVLLRARPFIDATPVDGVRIFIQPQFSRAFAQEESTIANNADLPGGATPSVNNVFDLHQGFIEFSEIGGSPISVKLGRQELAYGDERLIGTLNWNNVGRSHDAAKIRAAWERFAIDGFFSWVQRAGGNQYLGGIYTSWKATDTITNDVYALINRDNDGMGAGLSMTVITFGDRLAGKAWDDHVDYGLEAAIQYGKDQPNTHFAYAAHLHGGYTWEAAWKPRAGLEFNVASGDDPATAKVERFFNVYPTNHNRYGYIDFFSWRNMYDISPSLQVKPTEKTSLEVAYHLFMLPEPGDAVFNAAGAVLRAGAAGASRIAGHEGDLLFQYKTNKWLNFLGGYSIFKGGSFFSDTGTSGTAHFLYAQATASF